MAERLKGVPLSREVQGGFIAHSIAFSPEGGIVFDTPDRARERFLNRTRLKQPNGYLSRFRPFNGNQAIYDQVAAVARKDALPAKKPRGYSEGYWQMKRKHDKKLSRAMATRR